MCLRMFAWQPQTCLAKQLKQLRELFQELFDICWHDNNDNIISAATSSGFIYVKLYDNFDHFDKYGFAELSEGGTHIVFYR